MAKKEEESLDPKPKGKIVEDPELIAMNQISRIIGKLEGKAKLRVVAWLAAKLESPLFDVE